MIDFKWGESRIQCEAPFAIFQAVEESGVSIGEVYEELLKAANKTEGARVRWTRVTVFMVALLEAITKKPHDPMEVHHAITGGTADYEYVTAVSQVVSSYFPPPSTGKGKAASSPRSTSAKGSE